MCRIDCIDFANWLLKNYDNHWAEWELRPIEFYDDIDQTFPKQGTTDELFDFWFQLTSF